MGWWALIAGALGGLFLLAQYYLDLAENIEVLLLIAGITLIAVEFLTVGGRGTHRRCGRQRSPSPRS